jgi:hypothetical protein
MMKKKMAALLAGAMLMAAAGSANALTLTLQEGSLFTTVTGTGVAQYNGTFGDYLINVTTGLSVASTPTSPVMDLNTVNVNAVTTPAAALNIYLTQDGFTGVLPGFLATIGGTSAGTVGYETFLDTANNSSYLNVAHTPYATNVGLTSLSFLTSPFSGSATAAMPSISGSYSLTQEIDINQVGQYATTSLDATLSSVPEPGTMMLLGIGMLGLAVYGKRRMNKEA